MEEMQHSILLLGQYPFIKAVKIDTRINIYIVV